MEQTIRAPTSTWLHNLGDVYNEELFIRTNPTVMDWPMVSRDRLNFFIIFCYVMFVVYIGPAIMKKRKPFDLRWLMVPYNIALVVFNFYMFVEFAKIRWSGEAQVNCSTLKFDENSATYRLAEITWYFYISKYIELCDTIFFVLRKKDRQLSRLHLIHHSTVPLVMWACLRSEPGGVNTFFPLANSFVHCVMYSYYGISALGDEVTIHLKFKKYVTMTQMVQFITVLYYFISRPFYGCSWSWWSGVFNVVIAGFFFILFANFYWQEYCKRGQVSTEAEEESSSMSNGIKPKLK